MAQVAQSRQLHEWIDDYLDYLSSEWAGLPDLAAEWDEWDELSKLDFVIEWGVPADRLHQLHQWAEQDLLTPEQRARYDQLMALVAKYQPILDELLKD